MSQERAASLREGASLQEQLRLLTDKVKRGLEVIDTERGLKESEQVALKRREEELVASMSLVDKYRTGEEAVEASLARSTKDFEESMSELSRQVQGGSSAEVIAEQLGEALSKEKRDRERLVTVHATRLAEVNEQFSDKEGERHFMKIDGGEIGFQ